MTCGQGKKPIERNCSLCRLKNRASLLAISIKCRPQRKIIKVSRLDAHYARQEVCFEPPALSSARLNKLHSIQEQETSDDDYDDEEE